MGDGWTVPKTGYDIINQNLNYYVEMKNKHNTMNSSSSQKTYMRMQNTLLKNQQATCFLVEIIAPKSQNQPWQISLDGQAVVNDKIRRVSVDKFYQLVTGEKDAFKQLCQTLPRVISDVVEDIPSNLATNTVFEELQQLSPNILQSLYLLSFQHYEGFDNFHV